MLRFTLAEGVKHIQTVTPFASSQNILRSTNVSNTKDPGRIEFYGMGISLDIMNIRNLARNDMFTFLFSLGYTFEFFEDFNPFTIQQELIDRQVAAVVVNEDVIGSPKSLFLFGPGFPQDIKGVMLSSLWADETFRSFWLSRDVRHILPPGVNPLELVNAIGSGEPPIEQVRFTLNIALAEKVILIAQDDFVPFSISSPEPVTYNVVLTTQGVPVLSSSVAIPSNGVPPFNGFLKTNIGVNTVSGEHVISLVGTGGGFIVSDTIKYIVR